MNALDAGCLLLKAGVIRCVKGTISHEVHVMSGIMDSSEDGYDVAPTAFGNRISFSTF